MDKIAIEILKKRYLLKGETSSKMFRRVAKAVSKGNKKLEMDFFKMMNALDFLPNSPTLMNAGTKIGQLSACFVLPINDSIESIYTTLKNSAKIQQSGGGTGFNFSNIRPKNDIVKSSKGKASGPVSFIRLFNASTDIIKQGGKRRGANMALLNINHPDILEFINAKQHGLFNFNLSVAVTDDFMKRLMKDKNINLINPKDKKIFKKIKARRIWNEIINNAWIDGDPGIIFIDEINRKHPIKEKITSTNPCGEAPLLDYESCVLGSINLSHFVKNGKIDFIKLRKTAHLAVEFLDNVIDVNKFPLKEIEKKTKENRKIGLGVMGFSEMLIKLGISYNSELAIRLAKNVMNFINFEARNKSIELGKRKGSFPNIRKSKFKAMRNATVTTIAPTGTLSLIAETSSGIEPLFAVKYKRHFDGKMYEIVNKLWKKYPKKLFVTFDKVKLEQHVRIQAAFQKYTDNAVSKTVNLPNKATKKDVDKIFKLAYESKCKGITVYRYGSKKGQVICEVC